MAEFLSNFIVLHGAFCKKNKNKFKTLPYVNYVVIYLFYYLV